MSLEAPPIVLLRHVLHDAICVRERAAGEWGRFLSRSLTELETDGPAFERMSLAFLRRVARAGILETGT